MSRFSTGDMVRYARHNPGKHPLTVIFVRDGVGGQEIDFGRGWCPAVNDKLEPNFELVSVAQQSGDD